MVNNPTPLIVPQSTQQSSGELVAQLSKSYLDTNLEKTGKALDAVGVTSYLEEQGITKGIDKEGVKTILASFATFYLLYQAKKHWKKVLPTVGVIGLLIYMTKKPQVVAINAAVNPPSATPEVNNKASTVFGIRG